MSNRPTMDEFATRATHDGPIWRHQPSLRQMLLVGLVWSVLVAGLSAVGVLPDPPFDAVEWIMNFAFGVAAFVPAFMVVEVAYHRLLGR